MATDSPSVIVAMNACAAPVDTPSEAARAFCARVHARVTVVTVVTRNADVACRVLATCDIPIVIDIADCTFVCILTRSSFFSTNNPITPCAAVNAPVIPCTALIIPPHWVAPVVRAVCNFVDSRYAVPTSETTFSSSSLYAVASFVAIFSFISISSSCLCIVIALFFSKVVRVMTSRASFSVASSSAFAAFPLLTSRSSSRTAMR